MKTVLIFTSSLLLSAPALADTYVGGAAANVGAQLLLSYLLPKGKSKPLNKNEIKGSCYSHKGSCSGATITLYSLKGKKIDNQTFISDSRFHFTGLTDKKYKIVVDYPRYKTHLKTEIVTGKEVSLTLKENPN